MHLCDTIATTAWPIAQAPLPPSLVDAELHEAKPQAATEWLGQAMAFELSHRPGAKLIETVIPLQREPATMIPTVHTEIRQLASDS